MKLRHKQNDLNAVAILTGFPPPYGGVGVHVDRLIDIAMAEGVPYRVYDRLGKTIPERKITASGSTARAFLQLLITLKERVVHLHNNGIIALVVAISILSWRSKTVLLTIHSQKPMRNHEKACRLIRYLFETRLRKVNRIFAVSTEIADGLIGMGVPSDRVCVAPAFVPPSARHVDSSNLSKEIRQFLKVRSPIIGSHAWFGYFIDGVHVYSLDMIALLAKHLVRQNPTVGIYTVISGTYDETHRRRILDLRKEEKLEENWMIIETPFHAAALYAKTDVFVRPTITDGDSISIRECLHLAIPVIASDAVDRPAGCILHESRNPDALIAAVDALLAGTTAQPPFYASNTGFEACNIILETYRECILNKGGKR